MRFKKNMALFLLVLAGFVAGFFAGSYYVKNNFFGPRLDFDKIPQMITQRLKDELDLDETQTHTLKQLVESMHEQMMALHESQRPQAEKIKNEFETNIRSILSPQQQKRFDEVQKKLLPPFPKIGGS